MAGRTPSLFIFSVLLPALLSSGCFSNGGVRDRGAKRLRGDVGFTTRVMGPTAIYTPQNNAQAVTAAVKSLLNRIPDYDTEFSVAIQDGDSYRATISKLIEDPANAADLRAALMDEHRNYFGVGGSRAGSDVDFDGPAALGTYLAMNDGDYREIATANYCVTFSAGQLTRVPCDTFRNNPAAASTQAAGILSTRGFLATHKPAAAFNFRLVKEAFQKLLCSTYPDSTDRGTPAAEVSSAYAPWGLSEGRPSECYICHRSLNPKAFLFYAFDNNGFFTDKLDQTTRRDNNTASVPADLIVPGAQPVIFGKPLRTMADLGASFANDPRFSRCMTQRYFNYLMGRKSDTELPAGAQDIAKKFEQSGFKLKVLLQEILNSGYFVNRGQGS